MNLGEVKKKALSLMAEYSIDGVEISAAENADYLNRMNRFASDAQMEISDKVGIESSYLFVQTGTSEEGYNKYTLPIDFKEHLHMNLDDERFNNYRLENKNILVKKSVTGSFEFFYFKNPQELTLDTPDSYELEVDVHTQNLIPYFVGGMSLHDENPAVADRLLNMYFGKLNTVSKRYDDFPINIQSVYTV